MTYNEEVYEKLLENFEFLCAVINKNTSENQMKVDISKIEKIINKKIPNILKDNAPEDFYELYTDFKLEYEKFRDFILYDKLIGKNIVALGGGVSSGKTSFLNALMGKSVLPIDIDSSTSVPTYIVKGEKQEAIGINIFDTKVRLQSRDIKKIFYGFGEGEKKDDENIINSVTLKHILKNIVISTPLHKYENIAFLDIHGYSKSNSKKCCVKIDEQIARRQLNSSNYILWFVESEVGNITEKDIKFIKTLKEDIPMLVILNKADKKNLSELKDIIAKIKSTLDIKGVRYIDVLAFTNKLEQIEDDRLKEFIEDNQNNIKEQIYTWNYEKYKSNFAKNFKKLFVKCKTFYENKIDEESCKITRLSTVIKKLKTKNIEADVLEPLQLMVEETQKKVNELKDISKKLKELQNEFFTEIKYISDVVNIDMPEPSEIDLLEDKVYNPLQLIEEYKKEAGLKTDNSVVDMLQNIFSGIEPAINKAAGGSEYRKELIKIIKESCNLSSEDIHINDVYKNTKEYAELIRNHSSVSSEDIHINDVYKNTKEYVELIRKNRSV